MSKYKDMKTRQEDNARVDSIFRRILPIICDVSENEEQFVANMRKVRAAAGKYCPNPSTESVFHEILDGLADFMNSSPNGFDSICRRAEHFDSNRSFNDFMHILSKARYDDDEFRNIEDNIRSSDSMLKRYEEWGDKVNLEREREFNAEAKRRLRERWSDDD